MKTKKEITQELTNLKSQYGTVYELTVAINDDETEFATFLLRKLDRETYSQTMKIMQKDAIQAIELIVKKLWVGGDDINLALNDFDVLRALESPVASLYNTRSADIKKN